MSKTILMIEFWNVTPHIETAFEIAKNHLDAGDSVSFYMLGHDVLYKEAVCVSRAKSHLFGCTTPERRGASLLKSDNFHFKDNIEIPRPNQSWPNFDSVKELMAFRYKSLDIGMAAASSLVSLTGDSDPDTIVNCNLIHRMLSSFIQVFNLALELIGSLKPDLVYTFNGRFCNYRAVYRACEQTKTPVRLHERGANQGKYVVFDHLPHDNTKIEQKIIDYWNQAKNQSPRDSIARQFFEDRRGGKPKDWLSFTSLQQAGLLPPLPEDKRICTYFSSSDDEFVAIGDIFKSETWPTQMDAVLDLVESFKSRPEAHLVVRLHPHLLKKSEKDLRKWQALSCFKHITVIPPNSPVSSYALLDRSSVTLSYGSTMGIESVYWGVPSILVGPSFYQSLNACYKVKSIEEFNQVLDQKSLLADSWRALPYGYYSGSFGEEYIHYVPSSLSSGLFLGERLLQLSATYRVASSINQYIKRFSRRTGYFAALPSRD